MGKKNKRKASRGQKGAAFQIMGEDKKHKDGYEFDGTFAHIMKGEDGKAEKKYPFDGAYQRIWRAPNTIMKE
jgi:hypothetical protein